MEKRKLGKSSLEVSVVGCFWVGTNHVGADDVELAGMPADGWRVQTAGEELPTCGIVDPGGCAVQS